ncbi:MAG: acyl-CoA dehydrogenase family protein [Pseudomonadales bacterium]|jgi:alkylation response protein AidB-like acyl-CoA dehydrogenase|nr:acyl-CoA dehydrogenase family protein [Pseudomonadales bacterium]MDP6469735.1 acyl-CoA dehydrogenase family protein [Pseudomonadales bacterium]MDP6827664.1 acyl-CoA dehydrogenase family protein [Pseudomonadales bacterium]MDP6971896.1 acyl-CoA dehydrogenase family protein [Pseudomonadales bacterium]|tara:strand:+ start:1124 stop:2290 length:1167 start_codon:yes stop_codon:yes gene_type:complete
MSLREFQQEAAHWLEANCPQSLRGSLEAVSGGGHKVPIEDDDGQRYFDAMVERGWTVPHWPRTYGGAGLSDAEHQVLRRVMSEVGAPIPLAGMGTTMIGPTLLEHGTDEQKARHLPKIASGEIRWCQGYSEPGAGSDLASLKTRADDEGDYFLINGSKIWTSGAQFADWIFCLVRTDFDAPKHEGISFLLFSMDQPGVTVKPIRLISGASPFCECFFDDVRALKEDLVGQLNRGWSIAKRLLQHERSSISGMVPQTRSVPEVARQYLTTTGNKIDDPSMRASVIDHEMGAHAFALTQKRAREENADGSTQTFATSLFKLYRSELTIRRTELIVSMMGTRGAGWEGESFADDELAETRFWLARKAGTIAGGSSEVQRNVIAKRVLSLPD